MNEYRLTIAFCAVDESELLLSAFSKLFAFDEAFEYCFMLSKQHSEDCLKTVQGIVAQHKNCRYCIQPGAGLGDAIQEVMRAANGTHLLIWPADDGMDTTAFSKMLALSKQNPESIIKISRWLTGGGFEGYGVLRKAVNYISQNIFAMLFRASLTDFTNPTQIAPISVYRSIVWDNKDAAIAPEMVFKPLKTGVNFIEVPCKNITKRKDRSHISFFELMKYYWVVCKIWLQK